MLNIQSKKEAEMAVEKNKNRFETLKKTIINENLKRDGEIITNELLPRLKHTIALTHFFRKLEWFEFELPFIEFGNAELTDEEKCRIIGEYYFREGILWKENGRLGEVARASLVANIFAEGIKKHIAFRDVEINRDSGKVHFRLHLVDDICKAKVKKEVVHISNHIDEYVSEKFNFKQVAEEINRCYEKITGEPFVALYEGDMDFIPVFALNVEKVLKKTSFYKKIELPDESLKIQIDEYVRQSRLFKKMEKKLKNYGYKMEVEVDSPEDECFRYNQFKVYIDANSSSEEVKDESIVKSEKLQEAFNKKKEEYDKALHLKAMRQNEKLVKLVQSGKFDGYIAQKWTNATLMSVEKINGRHFKEGNFYNQMTFTFTVPFDREIPGLESFGRKFHVSDGVGTRYLHLGYSIVDAFKERYPFLRISQVTGDSFYDFKYREGMWGTDSYHIDENILEFGFEVKQENFLSYKQEIFEFLSTTLGTIDITKVLEEFQFNEEGVSEKIERYIQAQSTGDTSEKGKFKIVLGKTGFESLLSLYQESSFYEDTKKKFEDDERKEIGFWSYGMKEPYVKAKLKEFQSLKLSNLFSHALMVHPTFKKMKEELKKFDYELTIEYIQEEKVRMETGRHNIHGGDMNDDVCVYNVQIIVE